MKILTGNLQCGFPVFRFLRSRAFSGVGRGHLQHLHKNAVLYMYVYELALRLDSVFNGLPCSVCNAGAGIASQMVTRLRIGQSGIRFTAGIGNFLISKTSRPSSYAVGTRDGGGGGPGL